MSPRRAWRLHDGCMKAASTKADSRAVGRPRARGSRMHIPKNQIPVKIDAPGAVARQAPGFGDPSGLGAFSGEYMSLGAGADIAPLLRGLEDDACQAPHWGYLLAGSVVVTYTDSTEETCSENELFYWP